MDELKGPCSRQNRSGKGMGNDSSQFSQKKLVFPIPQTAGHDRWRSSENNNDSLKSSKKVPFTEIARKSRAPESARAVHVLQLGQLLEGRLQKAHADA
jgi:hypothetical protein